jgi:hypothetical protein
MRVIILSWEFPPRIVGKLADHVKELAVQLVKTGVDTYVVTYHSFLPGQQEEPEGIKTYRITNPVRTHIGVLTWVLTLNQEVERAAANIYYNTEKRISLIDAHDWHFIQAAVTLKKAFDLPFIYSVESLEDHRSKGAHSPFNMAIKSIEWLGLYEAQKVIVKSKWMGDEIVRIYQVPKDKIEVVKPNRETWIKDVLEIYSSVRGG